MTELSPLRISIVTSCFNMRDFVGDTVQSILSQKGPDDEYIFIDGGSTDGSLEIVQQKADQIDVLISESDDGQYHGISKGFDHARGDILAWLNADDILMPWTLSVVREVFSRYPEVQWITGSPSFLAANGQLTRVYSKLPTYPRRYIANGWFQKDLGAYLQQESMFWRRELWEKVGGLDTSYSLAADFELWTRFAEYAELVPVDVPLAAFRERPGQQRSSSAKDCYEDEIARACEGKPRPPALWAWIASKGIAARSAARLMITHPGAAIGYDRRDRAWKKTTRRRSISRIALAEMIDEWQRGRS